MIPHPPTNLEVQTMDNMFTAFIIPVLSPDDGVHLADAWFSTETTEEIVDDYFDGDHGPWFDTPADFPTLRLAA